MAAELLLSSAELAVTLLPEKGCDIVALVDRASGVDLLFKAPWRGLAAGAGQRAATSEEHWLARYPGGWQVLCPNAGAERDGPGVRWGFHGEACLVPWTLEEQSADRARLHTTLHTAPLTLTRELQVEGPRLRIEETVRNDGIEALELMWIHHPAFGAPLVEPGCRLSCGARTVVVDGTAHDWPHAGLERIPETPRALLAYLTDFAEPWFAVTNPRLGLGVHLSWPLDVFPHAWLWQELRATAGYPWFGRATVCAIEPASAYPADGPGGGVVVQPGAERTATLEAAVFHQPVS